MTPSEQSNSYDSLVDRYQLAIGIRRKLTARLWTCEPGTVEGQRVYRQLQAVESREAELRVQVRNHPDAPPQG